jgi:CRISPR/Cas system-associated endoribonuclease Cas2
MNWSGVRDRVIAVERARGGRRTQRGVFERVLTSEEIAEVESEIGVALPDLPGA